MKFKMKRYGIAIAFIAFITLCIGFFYVQAADNRYPNYTLIKQQGDENKAKNVFLRGIYEQTRMSPTVTIGLEGSQFASEQSLFERIDPYYWSSEEIKQLVKEHRQFMRGKRADSSFFEDDHLLVYANVEQEFTGETGAENFYFDVAVLDKKQKKSWSYRVDLPDSQLYRYINVVDVQVYEEEIIVVTRNNNKASNESEYHRYGFSLKDENVANPTDQIIEFPRFEDPGAGNSAVDPNFNLRAVFESDVTEPNRYTVFFATQTQNIAQNDPTATAEAVNNQEYLQEILSAQIMIYDLKNAQLLEIHSQEIMDFLDDLLVTADMNMKLEEDQLILTKNSIQGVRVIEYSITDDKVKLNDFLADSVIFSEVKGDHIYMLSSDDKDSTRQQPLLYIADLDSGEMVYQGAVEVSGTDHKQVDALNKLSIHQIIIK